MQPRAATDPRALSQFPLGTCRAKATTRTRRPFQRREAQSRLGCKIRAQAGTSRRLLGGLIPPPSRLRRDMGLTSA